MYRFQIEPLDVDTVCTGNRQIKTPIPAPGTAEMLSQIARVESRSMQGQMPIVWTKAVGHHVYDLGGNKFIDLTSTIFVSNVGHSNKSVVSNISSALLSDELQHTYAYVHKLRVEYITALVDFCDENIQKAFLLSAGTEATEAALKLMRLNARGRKRKPGIICIDGNWHGRTMGAQMMSGNAAQAEWIGYRDPNIHHIAFPYFWIQEVQHDPALFLRSALAELSQSGINLENDICGVMLETFQGWGAIFYPKEWVQALRKACDEFGWLLTFDEMQAGFGRTGKRFGYQHYDVQADLICCGKGIGSGVPLSAVLGSTEVMDLPETGNMSSTNSANPIVCAAGLATLNELLDNDLVQRAQVMGRMMFLRLEELRSASQGQIKYVSGNGLIAALIFDVSLKNKVSQICELSMQRGVLVVHTGRESIKIGPPLTISESALMEALDVLTEVVLEVLNV